MIGYEITITNFIELTDDVKKAYDDIAAINAALLSGRQLATRKILDGATIEVRIKTKKVRIKKPRNDAKRIIHADKE